MVGNIIEEAENLLSKVKGRPSETIIKKLIGEAKSGDIKQLEDWVEKYKEPIEERFHKAQSEDESKG